MSVEELMEFIEKYKIECNKIKVEIPGILNIELEFKSLKDDFEIIDLNNPGNPGTVPFNDEDFN